MTEQQAIRMALEAMIANNKAWKHLADSGDAGFWEAEEQAFYKLNEKAITALRQALEQEQDEPVALKPCGYESKEKTICRKCGQVHAEAVFDTRPQPAAWVGLTDEEIEDEWSKFMSGASDGFVPTFVKAIEAALRSKNT